jgi:hypothetical protein
MIDWPEYDRTGQLGQDNLDKPVIQDNQGTTARTGQLGQDSWDWAAGEHSWDSNYSRDMIDWPEYDRTGQLGQDNLDKPVIQDNQGTTARTGQLGQDSNDRSF